VPLNEPALVLDPDPRSVQEARRWVGSACRRLGREDLQECAELGISELVTNALLHADAPITVRLRGTQEHPRVEVSDGSAQLPLLTRHDPEGDELDDLMATVGRGLDIVAMCAVAWGATVESTGKCVWFEPAKVPHAGLGPDAVMLPTEDENQADDEPWIAGERVDIRMRDLPVLQLTESAASCGCSRSPTRTTTRWRRTSPKSSRGSSARFRSACARSTSTPSNGVPRPSTWRRASPPRLLP
jgi:anti-sigma regulatory factor (Ser/Thr protein kinase)